MPNFVFDPKSGWSLPGRWLITLDEFFATGARETSWFHAVWSAADFAVGAAVEAGNTPHPATIGGAVPAAREADKGRIVASRRPPVASATPAARRPPSRPAIRTTLTDQAWAALTVAERPQHEHHGLGWGQAARALGWISAASWH